MSSHALFAGRDDVRRSFLSAQGWGDALAVPVGEDSAMRRYFRLARDGRTAILMESLPDHDPRATPGHRMADFIRIAAWLRGEGMHAPEVYAADEANGYLLIEDMGDVSFRAALDRGTAAVALYELATDVLRRLAAAEAAGLPGLPVYEDSHVHAGRRRVVDWYMPALLGRRNDDGLAADYLDVWAQITRGLPPCPRGFLHIDYHVENLMMTDGAGLWRCGVLDFQGAMIGPLPYDLANLLEDARADVPPDLRRAMLARYGAGMDADARAAFESWYRVMATQFHCRLAGQFIRLALVAGKPRYLAFLPRVAGYLEAGLKDPVLAPLAAWFAENGVAFSADSVPDVGDETMKLIREDAF